MKFTNVIFISLLTWGAIFTSCGNESPSDHADALPHNRADQSETLTEADRIKLAEAKGINSIAIDPETFVKQVLSDSSTVLVINFWKMDCKACIALQQDLQLVQSLDGRGKLKLIAVNLDPEEESEKVDLKLRATGISSTVYQLTGNNEPELTSLVPNWDGRFPALAVIYEGELKAFYQRKFSKNELVAILQPYFL